MQKQGIPWKINHGFFLVMGGFTYDFVPAIRTLKMSDLPDIARQRRVDFGAITEEQINDKSKADALAKVITCFQATYVVVQVLGRVAQHLPITSLEVATVGYVPWTLLSYAFWWNKV